MNTPSLNTIKENFTPGKLTALTLALSLLAAAALDMPAAVVEKATPIRTQVSSNLQTLLEQAKADPSLYANDAPLIPPSLENPTAERALNKAAQSEGLPLPYPHVDAEDDEAILQLKAMLKGRAIARGDKTE